LPQTRVVGPQDHPTVRSTGILGDALFDVSNRGDIVIDGLAEHYVALGEDWFDLKEGEASIFRPQRGSSVLVAPPDGRVVSGVECAKWSSLCRRERDEDGIGAVAA
jgi:hypothetical protein